MNFSLSLSNVHIGHKLSIIQQVNAHARLSELIVLTGVNGSGKSTLLKTLAGIIPAISGEILLQGENIVSLNAAERAQKLAFVGTERIKEDYITIEDVVNFGQYPYQKNFYKHLNNHFIEEAIETMGIQNIRHKYLNNVSDGEWQKANIARALAQNTDIILLDEPSAFLDYPSRIRLFKDLKNICSQKNKTILVSTHDIETVKEFSQVFWHLEEGQLHILSKAPNWRL